jgi:hypothetical protein
VGALLAERILLDSTTRGEASKFRNNVDGELLQLDALDRSKGTMEILGVYGASANGEHLAFAIDSQDRSSSEVSELGTSKHEWVFLKAPVLYTSQFAPIFMTDESKHEPGLGPLSP